MSYATDTAACAETLNVQCSPTHTQVDAALAALKGRRALVTPPPPSSAIPAIQAAIRLSLQVQGENSVLPFDRNSLITLQQAFRATGLSARTASNYTKALKQFALYAGFAEFWAYRSPVVSGNWWKFSNGDLQAW